MGVSWFFRLLLHQVCFVLALKQGKRPYNSSVGELTTTVVEAGGRLV